MNNQAYIFSVDAAASFADSQWVKTDDGEDAIRFEGLNSKYKHLMFIRLSEGEHLTPMCSSDGKEWSVCIGASIGSAKLDLMAMAALLERKEEA